MFILCFCVHLSFQGYAAPLLLSSLHSPVSVSSFVSEARLVGMKISQDDPFRLSFIVDQVPENDPQLLRMVKYFLAGMTIPDRDLWVNLSPVQKDRILPERLARTERRRETGSDSGVSDTDSKGGLDMAGIDQVLRKDPVPEKVIGVSDCFDLSPEVDFSGIVPVILGSRTIKNALF